MTYKLLMHSDLEELEREINVALRQGFRLHGTLVPHNGNLCQAMIKSSVAEIVAKPKRIPRI